MSITLKSVLAKFISLGLILGLLAISTVVSVSKNHLPATVKIWFDGLRQSDASIINSILAENAIIELKDLGISQTKAEFIESLDEWQHANKNAKITTKLATASSTTIIVNVCYKFPSNEVFNQETFEIANDKITKSIQEQISEKCI